ncbi:hypothetical protein JR316_0006136 [Psilocybe cubensis]|uniref:Uncharacterized protein n=2 Tax=Psilocybe cubensis TaxID=181762 RepID=A0A8H7Y0A5_PSICU|nr:hypothetical protein JR316_0006136 [Psilocybe cubensis]KAH9481609.1 hypothetical protein JR316_0006136 [Psilocybe cubensis]
MSSSIIRRAVIARPALRCRTVVNSVRSYATPSNEEIDPQLNGYPQLPWKSRQELPPLGWQDPLYRRNFGDTLHEQEEVLSMWGPDVPPIAPNTAVRHFLIAAAGFVAFGFGVKYVLLQDAPVIRREYPYDGLVKELGGLEENKARIVNSLS